jgi:hypothetical protein
MNRLPLLIAGLALTLFVGAQFLGCQPADKSKSTDAAHEEHSHEHGDHDHAHGDHDHAHDNHEGHGHGEHGEPSKTYAEAVAKVEASRNAIRDGLAAGEKSKADGQLHELGHVLERIPELAKDFTAEQQAEVKKDVEELMDEFGKLDEQIHGEKEVTYDEFSAKIDAAIERLHERVAK